VLISAAHNVQTELETLGDFLFRDLSNSIILQKNFMFQNREKNKIKLYIYKNINEKVREKIIKLNSWLDVFLP